MIYQLLDQGKLKDAFHTIESLQGEERLEGVLWKTYFLLEVYGDLENATILLEQTFDEIQANKRLHSFFHLQKALILMWKGKIKESGIELRLSEKLLDTTSKNNQSEVSLYQGHLWLVKGVYSHLQGKYEQAENNYYQSLQIAKGESFPLKSFVSTVYNFLGLVKMNHGNHNKAMHYCEKSLTTLEELNNDLMKAVPMVLLGYIFMNEREVAQALEYSQKAFELAQKGRYKRIIAEALINLGSIYRTQGDLKKAEEYHIQAFTISKELKSLYYTAQALRTLGETYIYLNDLSRAEEHLQQALAFRKEYNNPHLISDTLYRLAVVYWALGDLHKVEDYLLRSLASSSEKSPQYPVTLNGLGELYRIQGELDKAKSFYQLALSGYEKQRHKPGIAMVQGNLGYVYWHQGEFNRAEESIREAILLCEQLEEWNWIAEWKEFLVKILLAEGRLNEAIEEVNHLGDLVQEKEMPFISVCHHLARGRLYLQQYNLTLALQEAKEAKVQATAKGKFELLVEGMKLSIRTQLQLYMNSKLEYHKTQLEVELQELIQVSKREHLYAAYIDTLLVQGMLKCVEFDLPGAKEQFEKAEILATELGLLPLARKAQIEIQQIHDQAEFFQQLMTQVPDAYKHLQMEALQVYLQKALVHMKKVG
ncbi:MAG: tetratricopeptide repeat protein [Promethearchaeota archaeon]